jgi:digeranylgeranylglycerophospholipid reductase
MDVNDFDYDAIVIGAGTAGLSAGIALQRAGRRYLILDKKDEIGLPVRSTGAVSLEWVKRLGMPLDPSIITSNINALSIRTDTGKDISMDFGRPIGLVYDFTRYEKFLSENMAGPLNIKLKTRVTSVKGNTVFTDSGEMSARYVIFASGPQSAFGEKLDRNNILVAYEETRKLPARSDYQMVLWYSQLAPGGYVWDFADSANTRKIGICFYPLSASQPKAVLDKFSEKFPELKGEMVHSMAHQIPLSAPLEKVVDGNHMFTGDMVNAVLNTTAGGLQGAFWTGTAAAEAVVAGDPMIYQKEWTEEISPWLLKHHRLHQKMHKKGIKSISRIMTVAKIMPMAVKKKVFGGL